MSVSIRITHDSISPGLARIIRQAKNPHPVLEAMGLQLASITQRAFDNPSLRASPWAALKPKTIAEKRKHGKSDVILKRSTELVKSFRVVVSGRSVTVGTNKIYAAIQQMGSAKKSGRGSGIPPRPFLPFREGEMTPLAKAKIEAIARAKVAAMLHP